MKKKRFLKCTVIRRGWPALRAEYAEEELGRRDTELAAGLGVAIGLIAIELVSLYTL